MAALEALANAAFGLLVSFAATYWLLPPLFGLHPSADESAAITAMFFGLSFTRSYVLRLLFRGIT